MELKLKRIAFLLLVIVAIFPFCSAEEAETMMVSTNQAVYRPGSQVVCAMENLPADSADLRFSLGKSSSFSSLSVLWITYVLLHCAKNALAYFTRMHLEQKEINHQILFI